MLMLFMLNLNPHFNLIDTVLGTRYAYTFKNANQTKVSYKVEGLLLLVVFIVKILKTSYNKFKS